MIITAATLAAGLLLMFGVKAIGILRISEAGEIEGLDIHDHGAPAYHPEYAYMGYSPLPPSLETATASAPTVTAPPSDIHLPSQRLDATERRLLRAVEGQRKEPGRSVRLLSRAV